MSINRLPLPPRRQLLPISDVGVVLLGEDGGEALLRGLAGWLAVPHRVVYADSQLTEELARFLGSCGVLCVSPQRLRGQSREVCRAEAMREMLRSGPKPAFIQLLRSGSVLSGGWLHEAVRRMAANSRVGLVCGRVRLVEQSTARHRLQSARANSPAGNCCTFPAEALVRTDAFEVVASDGDCRGALGDTEFVDRLLANGWDAVRIAVPMTQWHAETVGCFEWLRQQYRMGYQESKLLARSRAPQVAFACRLRWRWGLALAIGFCSLVGLGLSGAPIAAWAVGVAVLGAAVASMLLYPWQAPAALVQERNRSVADWSVLGVSTAIKMCGDLAFSVERIRSSKSVKRFPVAGCSGPVDVKLSTV